MKLVNKETDYAVRAILYMASHERYVSSREIADEDKIPLRFLRRILLTLKNNKYIETKEGKTGGVKLMKKPENILLADVIKLFQGKFQFTECMFRGKICHNRTTCVLRKRILNIEAKVAEEFEKITIKTLINDSNHKLTQPPKNKT